MNPLDYFSNVFKQPFTNIQFKNTNITEIKTIIKSLTTKNCYGYNVLSNIILKISMPFITSPVTYICNKALTTGEFPTHLEYAEVKPLFKSGENTELSNYRPIYVLTSFSKIFEKIIYKRLYHHLNYNNILVNQKFGFRKNLCPTLAT
jgi:hypothetical protein